MGVKLSWEWHGRTGGDEAKEVTGSQIFLRAPVAMVGTCFLPCT